MREGGTSPVIVVVMTLSPPSVPSFQTELVLQAEEDVALDTHEDDGTVALLVFESQSDHEPEALELDANVVEALAVEVLLIESQSAHELDVAALVVLAVLLVVDSQSNHEASEVEDDDIALLLLAAVEVTAQSDHPEYDEITAGLELDVIAGPTL